MKADKYSKKFELTLQQVLDSPLPQIIDVSSKRPIIIPKQGRVPRAAENWEGFEALVRGFRESISEEKLNSGRFECFCHSKGGPVVVYKEVCLQESFNSGLLPLLRPLSLLSDFLDGCVCFAPSQPLSTASFIGKSVPDGMLIHNESKKLGGQKQQPRNITQHEFG